MTTTEAAPPAKATRREWLGLAVLALAALMYVMDLTVLHLAVPMMSADLQPTSAELLWIINIYGFFVAGALITMGSLGDRSVRSALRAADGARCRLSAQRTRHVRSCGRWIAVAPASCEPHRWLEGESIA